MKLEDVAPEISSIQRTLTANKLDHNGWEDALTRDSHQLTVDFLEQKLNIIRDREVVANATKLEDVVQGRTKLVEQLKKVLIDSGYEPNIDGYRLMRSDIDREIADISLKGLVSDEGGVFKTTFMSPATIIDFMDGSRGGDGVLTRAFTNPIISANGVIRRNTSMQSRKLGSIKERFNLTGENSLKIGVMAKIDDLMATIHKVKDSKSKSERFDKMKVEVEKSIVGAREQNKILEDVDRKWLDGVFKAVERDISDGNERNDYKKDFLDEGELEYFKMEDRYLQRKFDESSVAFQLVTGQEVASVIAYARREALYNREDDIFEASEGIPFIARDNNAEYISGALKEQDRKGQTLTPSDLKKRADTIEATNVDFFEVSRRQNHRMTVFAETVERASIMYRRIKDLYDAKLISKGEARLLKTFTDMFHRGQGNISGDRMPGLEGTANSFALLQLGDPTGGLSTQLLNPFEKGLTPRELLTLYRGRKDIANGIKEIDLSEAEMYRFINNEMRFILGEKTELAQTFTTSPKYRNSVNKIVRAFYRAEDVARNMLAQLDDAPNLGLVLGFYKEGLIKKYGGLNKSFYTREGADRDLIVDVIRTLAERTPSRDRILTPHGFSSTGLAVGGKTQISASTMQSVFSLQSFQIKQFEKAYSQAWRKPKAEFERGEISALQAVSKGTQTLIPQLMNSILYFYLRNARSMLIHHATGNQGEPTGYDVSWDALMKHLRRDNLGKIPGADILLGMASTFLPKSVQDAVGMTKYDQKYGEGILEGAFGTVGEVTNTGFGSGGRIFKELVEASPLREDKVRERSKSWLEHVNSFYNGGGWAVSSGVSQHFGSKPLPVPFGVAPTVKILSKISGRSNLGQQALYLQNEVTRIMGDVPGAGAGEKEVLKYRENIKDAYRWFNKQMEENEDFAKSFRRSSAEEPNDFMHTIIRRNIKEEYNLTSTPKEFDLEDPATLSNLANDIYNARMIRKMPKGVAEEYARLFSSDVVRYLIEYQNENKGGLVLDYLGLPRDLKQYTEKNAREWLGVDFMAGSRRASYENVLGNITWNGWYDLRSQVRKLLEFEKKNSI